MRRLLITVVIIVYGAAWTVAHAQQRDSRRLVQLSKVSGNPWDSQTTFRSARGVAVYKSASPGVVLILNVNQEGSVEGLGSGSILSAAGDILTSWHVVSGYENVLVVFKPRMEGAEPAKDDLRVGRVIKVDPAVDLALIKVPDVPAGHPPVSIGDEIDINIGADVHAIGHPTGQAWTYTAGVVSQVRRSYEWSYARTGVKHRADVVQTQTPISPGNSGGPLLSDAGSLIGVNTFGYAAEAAQNLNFAISIREIRAFLLDRRSASTGMPQGSRTIGSTNRAEDVTITEVRVPYPKIAPGTVQLVVFNSSTTPVQQLTFGALVKTTADGRCPTQRTAYNVLRAVKTFVAPKDSAMVMADFPINSEFFCIIDAR